jgi:hypothetical protein
MEMSPIFCPEDVSTVYVVVLGNHNWEERVKNYSRHKCTTNSLWD